MYMPIHILQYILLILPIDLRLKFKSPPRKISRDVCDIIKIKLMSSPTIRIAVMGTAETPNHSMEIIFVRKDVLKTLDTTQNQIDTSQLVLLNPHPIFQTITTPQRLVHFSIFRLTCGEFQYHWSDYSSLAPEFINVMVQPLTKLQFPIVKYEPPFTFFIYRFYN